MVSEAELNQYGNSSIAFPNYFGLAYIMLLLMASFTGAISRTTRQGSSRPNPLSRDVHYSTALCCNVNHAFVNWSAVAAGIAVGEWFLEHLNRTTGIINETQASRSGQRSTLMHTPLQYISRSHCCKTACNMKRYMAGVVNSVTAVKQTFTVQRCLVMWTVEKFLLYANHFSSCCLQKSSKDAFFSQFSSYAFILGG